MRILILSPHLPHAEAISGHQIVYQRIVRLMEAGHEVGVACFVHPEVDLPFLERMPPGLLEVATVPQTLLNRLTPPAFKRGRLNAASSFFRYRSRAMARKVGAMVDQHQYDVVLAEFTAMGQFLHRNPYLAAVRKVISCHDSPTLGSRKLIQSESSTLLWAKRWIEYKHMRHMELTLYRCADRVLTLTPEERLQMLEEDPTLRITTVLPGLHSDVFAPLPNLPKEHCIIITGRYSSEQTHYGTIWFLRTVWRILRERDPELRRYLVGRDPSPLMKHIGSRDPRVMVTGMVDNLRPYLAKSKVYVCPLLSGTGLRGKLLEAMAMELPLVATTTAAEGIPVRMGDNAMLADTPEIMADTILMLLNDPEKCRAMGKAARRTVEAQFTWEHSMAGLKAVLEDVTTKRSYHLGA